MLSHARTLTIEWGDCDPAGIVFYPRYLAMFNASTDAMLQAAGINASALFKRHQAIGWPMVDTHASFSLPTAYGDQVRICSSVVEVARTRFHIRHQLYAEDGRLAVNCLDKRVWAVAHPQRPGELKSAPLPDERRQALTSNGTTR